jgi:hypothetical protein
MNAHVQPTSPAPPSGSLYELRQFIADHVELAGVYLAHAADCALLGDDFGLKVALTKHGLYMKAVRETFADLVAKQKRAAAPEGLRVLS